MVPRRSLLFLFVLLVSISAIAQDIGPIYAVAVPVADMHSRASADSDVVSQTTFGATVKGLDSSGKWVKIRTGSDDYEGWVRATDVQRVTTPYAVRGEVWPVASLFAVLYREPDIEKHAPVMTVPFGVRLEITGHRETPDGVFREVRLPAGGTAWVQSNDLGFSFAPLSIDDAILLARRFIGLPYRWGGTTSFGFDCSGFTQMLMRQRGIAIPRDTRPQARWDGFVAVEREALQPGDLIFFGKTKEKINHTGMYIGDGQFIHATRYGDSPTVQIGRLSSQPWTSHYITARRVK